jgi:hypothetical protein
MTARTAVQETLLTLSHSFSEVMKLKETETGPDSSRTIVNRAIIIITPWL